MTDPPDRTDTAGVGGPGPSAASPSEAAPRSADPAPVPDSLRLGIFGGTFDPVHNGHINSALQVAEAFKLDRVLLIVAAVPPHKSEARPAPAAQRHAMVQLAVADHPILEASELELTREGPSYTYDTVVELTALYPRSRLFLILGADAYAEIDSWHRPADIWAFANLIVTSRAGYDHYPTTPEPFFAAKTVSRYDPEVGGYLHSSGHTLTGFDLKPLDVSASEIRNRLGRSQAVAGMLASSVERYIRDQGIYGAEKDSPPS